MENTNENYNVNLQDLEKPMTIGNWIGTQLLLLIPVVNIILLFVWAFGNTKNRSKKTYCQASLIMIAIVFVLYFALFASILSAIRY